MKYKINIIDLLIAIIFSGCNQNSQDDFVKVKDSNFLLNNKEYNFIGSNY